MTYRNSPPDTDNIHRRLRTLSWPESLQEAKSQSSAALVKQEPTDQIAYHMADLRTKSTAHTTRHFFRLAIDYGTTKVAAAWQISNSDSSSVRGPYDVRFSKGEFKAPNIAAYDNGRFIWGRTVADRLASEDLEESQIIRFAKLAIFTDPQTRRMKDTVTQKLEIAGKTIANLLEDSLRSLIAYSIQDARCSPQGLCYDIDNMELQLFLSVPQMWNPPANRVMTKAVEEIKASNCELVYEPECAAIHAVVEQLQPLNAPSQSGLLQTGDVILVADIGGGTADFVSYEIRSNLTERAHTKLQTAHRPNGQLCGSQWVNEAFLNWVIRTSMSEKEYQATLTKLDMKSDDFLAHASLAFEREKLLFSNTKKNYDIFLVGRKGRASAHHHIRWNLTTMRSFFDSVINRIIDELNELLKACKNIKVIMVPGGFGHCPYLLAQLRRLYEPAIKVLEPANATFPNPVTRGALLRHKLTVRGAGSQFSWGTLIAEEWDPKLHPDTVLKTPVALTTAGTHGKAYKKIRVSSMEPRFDKSLVFSDPIHPDYEHVVLDRWSSLLVKGELFRTPYESKPQYRLFYPKKPATGKPVVLEIDIYWSEYAKHDHEPGRKRIPKDGDKEVIGPAEHLQDDVYHWETIQIDVHDPRALGWQLDRQNDGTRVYEVYVCYALVFNGPNVEFVFDLRQRDKQPYDVHGNPREVDNEPFEWEPQWRRKIWSASHNPFPKAVEETGA